MMTNTPPAKPKSIYKSDSGYLFVSWRPYVLLLVLGVLAFGQSVGFSFVYFDDDILILREFKSIERIVQSIAAFQVPYLDYYYRPLVTLSLIYDAQISGQQAWMYHTTNVLLHLAASCLVFTVMRKLSQSRRAALFAGALFAVHPLGTNAIAWIIGRNDSLLAVVSLLSLLTFISEKEGQRTYRYVVHQFLFMSALFVKETAIVLPVLYLFYAVGIRKTNIRSREIGMYSTGWILCLLVWYCIRSSVLNNTVDVYSITVFASRLRVVIEMIGKMVFPVRLSTYPMFDDVPLIAGCIAIVGFLFVLFVRKELRTPIRMFASIWIVLCILPGLGVRLTDSQDMYHYLECRAYTSLVGFCILLGSVAQPMFEKNFKRSGAAAALVVGCCIILSVKNGRNYRDAVSYWECAAEMSPVSANVFYKLGIAYSEVNNDPLSASKNYEKAITLNPRDYEYHDNLGIEYGKLGYYEKAEAQFKEAIALNPMQPFPRSNIGYLYILQGKLDSAKDQLLEAYRIDSSFLKVHELLAEVYRLENNIDSSMYFARTLRARSAQ